MKSEHYIFTHNKGLTRFKFVSVGRVGKITKIIQYERIGKTIFNLAFGDKLEHSKGFDDRKISNNNDLKMVIGTVAQTVLLVSTAYPDHAIYIRPVDEKRKRLYNFVFQRNLDSISERFQIFGEVKTANGLQWMPYNPEKQCETFMILSKAPIFDR